MAIKKGVQMFSVRHMTKTDLPGAIARMAKMGYDGIEFAGYFGHSAAQLRAVLDDCGVAAAGSHIGLDMLEHRLNEVIDFSAELGEKYVICPFIPQEYRDTKDAWLRTAALFERIGEQTARAGIALGYHNHDYSFFEFDGQFGIDLLYGNTSPEYVKMQLDVGNAEVTGKATALGLMRKYADRCALLHMKDIAAVGDHTDTPVGDGIMDIPAIVKLGKELGVDWYTVEYEGEHGDILGDVARSCAALAAADV
ncbi:MAG: sugar phosphate isomerase/epimerase [Eubacteriales bacterium]|nr:sugar phosphate isomerase/epimerase [Eubacteriales bacterium]